MWKKCRIISWYTYTYTHTHTHTPTKRLIFQAFSRGKLQKIRDWLRKMSLSIEKTCKCRTYAEFQWFLQMSTRYGWHLCTSLGGPPQGGAASWSPRHRLNKTKPHTHNKSPDTGKLMLAVDKYVCLVKEDQIENNRKNNMACQALLKILHPQSVRKMITVDSEYAGHPTSELDKGKIGFKLPRI